MKRLQAIQMAKGMTSLYRFVKTVQSKPFPPPLPLPPPRGKELPPGKQTEQGSESEEEEETAPEKRLRLAKEYISQLEEEGRVKPRPQALRIYPLEK